MAALRLITQKGIRKTTVDELVKCAKIPKGTFYLFYESKEMLLYDAIMKKFEILNKELEKQLSEIKENLTEETLTSLLQRIFVSWLDTGIVPLMLNGDIDLLLRKLPEEIIADYRVEYYSFSKILKSLFPQMSEISIQNFSVAFTILFHSASYKRQIGDAYEAALRILIRGVVIQMMEEQK